MARTSSLGGCPRPPRSNNTEGAQHTQHSVIKNKKGILNKLKKIFMKKPHNSSYTNNINNNDSSNKTGNDTVQISFVTTSNDQVAMATSATSYPPDVQVQSSDVIVEQQHDGSSTNNNNIADIDSTVPHSNNKTPSDRSKPPTTSTSFSTTTVLLKGTIGQETPTTAVNNANHEIKSPLKASFSTASSSKRESLLSKSSTVITKKISNTNANSASASPGPSTNNSGHTDVVNVKKHRLNKRASRIQKFASRDIQNGYDAVPVLDCTMLPRGGISLDTNAIGRIQYGIPPETIKDSMCLGLDVPIYYIVPVERFCREVGTSLGVNLAEFEFPAYFNFFVKKLRCTLIVDSDEAESNIRRVFSETLLGPIQFRRSEDPFKYEDEDFATDYPRENIPNFMRELKHFRIMPDKSELGVETLLEFRHFAKLDKKQNGCLVVDLVGVPEKVMIEGVEIEAVMIQEAEEDEDDVMKNWSFLDVVTMAEVATIWPPKSTSEERAARSVPRVEVYKMPGGTEYIIHDIDKNNTIIGKARFAGNVRVSDSMSVEGFEYLEKVVHTNKEDANSNDNPTDSSLSLLDQNVLPPTFHPPSFGVTVLGNSHGFDKSGSTSGYVLWINGRGVMIDPPPYSSATLEREGIRPRTIVGIILTHCHADHDAGAFQKVLTGSPVVVITTPTIYKSFIRKYAALSALSPALLRHSHRYKPAIIGTPLRFQGATLHFSYTLHSIPCVGFRVEWRGRSMVFTGDHYNNPEGIDKLIDSGVMSKGRGEDLKALPLQDTDLLLHEAGAPPIHTPLSVLMALPQRIKDRLYVVHTSALPEGCDLRVAPTGTAGTIRLDEHLIPAPNSNDMSPKLRLSGNLNSSVDGASFGYDAFQHDYDPMIHASIAKLEHPSYVSRMLPLVSLRPTSSTDAWFILNLLSAVPFLTSLSYVTTMEVLETARVDTFCMNDTVVPAHRRRDVLCVVWEGTCMEREITTKAVDVLPRRNEMGTTRRTSHFNLNQGSHEPLSRNEIRKHKKRPVAVWHAGDWTGPRSVQPDKKLSGESSTSETHDIVAMSSQGIKAINIEFSNLHSILKSGSELYRKYLARKHKVNESIPADEDTKTSAASKKIFEAAIKDLSIVELLETNSALKKLSAVQKRHFECLAEGPVYFSQGQRLWRSGTVVDKAYLIVAGTAVFLAGRRNGRTMGSAGALNANAAAAAAASFTSSDSHNGKTTNSLKQNLRRANSKDMTHAVRLVREEEESDYTIEVNEKRIVSPQLTDNDFLSDTDQVKKEFNDSDSSLSSDNQHEGSFASEGRLTREGSLSSSAGTFDLDSSIGTFAESADFENLKLLVKGFKNRADCIHSQPVRRTSESSTDSIPSATFAEHSGQQSHNDRFANKVLGRLYTRKKFTSNLVFSRGHFLGDVSKMVAGLLTGESKPDESSGDDESFKYGYGDKPIMSGSRAMVATIHEREGDEHIVHNSTLVAGKDGCVVLIFPKSKICPFLDEYPGILLSLLGTQVVV